MKQDHITNEITEAAAQHAPGYVDPDLLMLVMTWFVFLSVFAILYKFAWKPILAGLDARENSIRQSVENADRIKSELERLDQLVSERISEADKKAQHIVEESRHAATQAAKAVHAKAKEEAQITLENARREIKEEVGRAKAALKQESAKIAIELAGKIIHDNLDNEKNKALIEGYIKEL